MIYQGLRDRLLVWYSHCEVQMQQIENGTTTEPLQMLNQLQEEIHNLDGMRAEIFHVGQALVQQGTCDIQPDLDDYLRVENETMLKLAQMRISFAQQPPESTSTPALNGKLYLSVRIILSKKVVLIQFKTCGIQSS